MRKTIALIIIAIFVFSLIPLAFARNTAADANDKSASMDDPTTRVSEREPNVSTPTQDPTIMASDRMKDAREKNRERLAKIRSLDQRQIERLSALNVKNVEKIAELKKERLDKLAKLNEEKLGRILELEKDKLDKISDLNETEIEKASVLGRARLKELAEKDPARLRAELSAIKTSKIRNADNLAKRDIPAARLAQVRERFEKAKEEFKSAKDGLNDESKKLKEARGKGDEKAVLEHAKAYLLKTADALINHLEKIKAKVQESENIADDREAQLVAEIDAQIAEINKIKTESQSATTKEQIKSAAKKLDDKWKRLKPLIRMYSEVVVSARVEGIVNTGLVLEKQLDNVLAKAKEKGIEVDVSAEINAFSEKIANSREKYKQAQSKLSEALGLKSKNDSADSEKVKALTDEAETLLKSARDALKEAHDILKSIVKKIKEAVPDADLSEETEVEVEQEKSTETGSTETETTTEANATT